MTLQYTGMNIAQCTYKFYTVYLHAVYVYYTCCPSLMILFKPTFHTVKK